METIGVIASVALFFILLIGLFIALGRVVYKDAKAHNMSAGLWTAVVVLVPNLIGLIIYLVVRNNVEKQYHCSKCGEAVKEDYNLCPNCKSIFEKICQVCKNAVKSSMVYCPYCGNKVDEMEDTQTASKVVNKTNIVKPLVIIGGSYIALIILFMTAMFGMAFASGEMTMGSTSVMEMEINTSSRMESTFKYKSGNEQMTVKLDTGETQTIDVEIGLTSGWVELIAKNPEGEMVYQRVYEVGTHTESFDLIAGTPGKYKIYLKVEGASGNYKISKAK